ncbi:PH domain-containing protein [Prosthecobacter fluviatilis]|uniref:PH domain-containing protein n=1 Tax=Prosthecobacter fluviatilis TaxID=445931 RepID=A0ABW0KQS9_9BACT
MKSYRHSPIVHLIGPGFPIFMGWMIYRVSAEPVFRGGTEGRVAFAVVCTVLALFVGWLYWRTGLNRYQVTDEGLVVSRLRSSRLIPWGDIDEMVWNRLAHCVFIKGKGRTLVFTSSDQFDDLPELMDEISCRSQCKLSPNLQGVLKS